jgi:flagellar protein FlgJ
MTALLAATGLAGPSFLDNARAKARELEGVFLNTLMSEMFSSVEAEGGYAEETWRSMQAEQMAGAMAETGGIGLADDVLRSLIELQQSLSQPAPDGARP